MVTMPKTFIHEQHNAMPGVSMVDYLVSNATRNGIPIPESVTGTVRAELHRGRWIARCLECSNACLVTSLDPIYFCPDCGAGWYEVLFPKNKTQIEAELMKRPVERKGLVHVNWSGETMKQLRAETLEAI